MKLTIFGSGYVGLVTAACFAKLGHEICCVDIDQEKINNLQQGILPLYEPELEKLIHEGIKDNSLKFTFNPAEGISFSSLYMIAVNTPPKAGGQADTSAIFSCISAIAEQTNAPFLIVNKSTAPVGTVDAIYKLVHNILENRQKNDIKFDVASNPEFLREGSAVFDCLHPDRIILGAESAFAKELLFELYRPFDTSPEKILLMGSKEAELTKYAANAMLATKISFINEISRIAELYEIKNIKEVQKGLALDPRIGPHFISPGCGFGGACFPKDVQALSYMATEKGLNPYLLNAVYQVNQNQKKFLGEKILKYFNYSIQGKTFALWGLAFKPNTNDIREAPSCELMEYLWKHGAKIQAYDPAAMPDIHRKYKDTPIELLKLLNTKEECLINADALIICTEWKEFINADMKIIKEKLNIPIIFDGRNIFDPASLKKEDIFYLGVGLSN